MNSFEHSENFKVAITSDQTHLMKKFSLISYVKIDEETSLIIRGYIT